MSLQAFESAIVSPALKNVASHWGTARGTRTMPAWSHIKPASIAAQLPMVWSYTFDRATESFTGRLAGNAIAQIFGKNFRGVPMSAVHPQENFHELFALCKRVLSKPGLYRGAGMLFRQGETFGIGERILMPLADDGTNGDGIFGATEYELIDGTNSRFADETSGWFEI